MKKYIILGGGITGLSLAWKLADRGFSVTVLESEKTVGGLAATLREDDYCLDMGPHSFFTEDNEIRDFVLNLFQNRPSPKQREVRFYYQGKYLDYPFTLKGMCFDLGVVSGLQTAFSFLFSKIIPVRKKCGEETVEDWAVKSFGAHLYKTFFKPYTEQFWKIPCNELSSRTIPNHENTSFINTCRVMIQKHMLIKRGSSLIEREMLPTYYPETGFGEIPELFAKTAREKGAEIKTECTVTEVEVSGSEVSVSYENNGKHQKVNGNYVISTIPVTNFVKMFRPEMDEAVIEAAEKLEYRSFTALGMVTEKQKILGCGYIYVINRPYNRISEMNEFSPYTSPPQDNIIMIEIPCLLNSVIWHASKEELFDMCIGKLSEDISIGPGDVKKLLFVKSPYAYPIYRTGYHENLKNVLSAIQSTERIYTLGRSGEFMYMDIDKCIKKAFDFCDKLLQD